MVAPSDMMDGRVRAIRTMPDQAGSAVAHRDHVLCSEICIRLYGPFQKRQVLLRLLVIANIYQMDFHTKRRHQRGSFDVEEGADIIMVKPAMAYQDVITEALKKWSTHRLQPTASAENMLW